MSHPRGFEEGNPVFQDFMCCSVCCAVKSPYGQVRALQGDQIGQVGGRSRKKEEEKALGSLLSN